MATVSIVPLGARPALSDREYQQISRLAHERFGLDFGTDKKTLIAARLAKMLRELGLKSFEQYYHYILSDRTGVAISELADRLTTNHTSFFREQHHFDFLRKVVFPALRGRHRIDIWSAACSSGEEPFSIAMSLLEEAPREAATRVCIKASDISTRMLAMAKGAIYPKDRVAGIPPALLQRYLVRDESEGWRFNSQVRSMVDFERRNLMDPFPQTYHCSVIFCRNIMIYFDKPTRQSLVQRLSQHLEAGGYLFVGHSESLNGIAHGLEYVSPATYRKPALRAAAGGAR